MIKKRTIVIIVIMIIMLFVGFTIKTIYQMGRSDAAIAMINSAIEQRYILKLKINYLIKESALDPACFKTNDIDLLLKASNLKVTFHKDSVIYYKNGKVINIIHR